RRRPPLLAPGLRLRRTTERRRVCIAAVKLTRLLRINGELRRPILNRHSANLPKIVVFGHNDAMRKGSGDSADLHVDLLNYFTGPLQLGEDATKLCGRGLRIWPNK